MHLPADTWLPREFKCECGIVWIIKRSGRRMIKKEDWDNAKSS